ncbi:hypothetical protein PHISP_07335 [Aspergillus sp. HF37]|nr:hypothetical protein PHISP_07335 [Aspergillus sp. HF37]
MMHSLARVVASALAVSSAAAVYTGFNYGDKFTDGSIKQQSDYEKEFSTAKNLVGAEGFTSARLYTSKQDGTGSPSTPISAIPAAIAKDTSLLLGIWASAGQQDVNYEIDAIKSAIDQYGDEFTSRVAGISVGSEDLYRQSVIGDQNNEGVGAGPETIASYIDQVRSAVSGTGLASAPIGHVDTWTAWTNGSNQAAIDACDWIGFDAYPYFQGTMSNSIENAKELFQEALSKTKAAVGGRPVWVTETGWPVSGPTVNKAVPSPENAQTYWEQVGCGLLFDNVNTWWYTLHDGASSPSFGVVGNELTTKPAYDLSCSASGSPSSSSAMPSSSSAIATSAASSKASGSTIPSGTSGAGGGIGGSSSVPSGSAPTGSAPTGSAPTGSAPAGSMTSPSAPASSPHGSSSVPAVPSFTGSIGGNAPSPSMTPSASGGGVGGGVGGGASGSPGAGGGSGNGGSGSGSAGDGQAPTGVSPSSSASPSAPVYTGSASAAKVPTMGLGAAVAAIFALL